ncbi:hypothetical protein M9458_037317, partial [Cirrhinus mrigala]
LVVHCWTLEWQLLLKTHFIARRHDLIPTAVYGNSCSKSHGYDTCSTYGPDSTSYYPL